MAASLKVHHDMMERTHAISCGGFCLYALGEIAYDTECKIDEPADDGYTALFVSSGKARITVGGDTVGLTENDMMIILPNIGYTVTVEPGTPVRGFYISVLPIRTMNERLYPLRLDGYFDNLPYCKTARNFDAHNLHFRIAKELRHQDDFSMRVIELNLEQLWISLVRSLANMFEEDERRVVRDDGGIVDRIIAYIDANCGNIRNLNDISRVLGYSYPYLSHVFSKRMGKSIKEYYQQILFERAAEMLKADISVTQISERLGYQAIHSFSRAFSNYYGMPPSRYISELRKRNNADDGEGTEDA